MGTSSVTVTAKDDAGNTSECTINVTVQDTAPPIFTVIPDDIERECTGGSGTSVSFSVSADDVCGVASIVCKDQNGRTIDPDGTLFGDGNYTITCTATDPAGNQRQINFNITVSDNTNPALLTPNDIVVGNDAGECFARVTFQVTATDACDPNVAVTMTVDGTTVQSGDAFPVGTSTVTVKAKDKSGNEAIKTFNITVEDREDPVLSAPATATVVTDCKGLVLAIDAGKIGASATDNCDGSVAVIVSPALLTPGTHTVSLSSTDAAGNEATSSLQVTVLNGAFDCTVLRPLDPNVDNKIRVGRVVPIKIRVSCDNVAESAGLTVTVDQVSEINAAGTPINNEVAEDAGLSSDNTLLFRLVDGHFHYNLQTKGWKTGSGVRHRVDVRVKKAGHVDTVYSVYLINK